MYLDATGSIVKKTQGQSAPFYVYELVVRNPTKGASPIPVMIKCDGSLVLMQAVA